MDSAQQTHKPETKNAPPSTEKKASTPPPMTADQRKLESALKTVETLQEEVTSLTADCSKAVLEKTNAVEKLVEYEKHVAFVEKVSLQDRQKVVDMQKDVDKAKAAVVSAQEERDSARNRREKETTKRQESSAALTALQKEHDLLKKETAAPSSILPLEGCLGEVQHLSKDEIELLRKALTKRMKEVNGNGKENS